VKWPEVDTSLTKGQKKLGLLRWMNSAASRRRGVSDHLAKRLAATDFSWRVGSVVQRHVVAASEASRIKHRILICLGSML